MTQLEIANMIDLTKEQVFTEPVKCWVRDYDRDVWFPRWLVAVGDDGDVYYAADKVGHDKSITILDAIGYGLCKWSQCVLIDPYGKKVKKWLTVDDVPTSLWGKALFKDASKPNSYARILAPMKATDEEGKLYPNLVYLPQGQPLSGTWLPFESEVVE